MDLKPASPFLNLFWGGHNAILVNKICKQNMYSQVGNYAKMTCILYVNDVMDIEWMTQVYMWITMWKWWIIWQKTT